MGQSHTVLINKAIKKYGDFTALNGVEFSIKTGEFFTLLGPSGCGKTTLLRMIAGFNTIDGGEILFDDTVINSIEAYKRDIGMVFQNYAIFPHMSVSENVAYGLKARKIPASEIPKLVENALDLVQIKNLANRKPSELSGGQQQRVALARAVVIEPGLLLMDEPLSNLDAKLRVQMRTVIRKLQRRLAITTIYVTHDQEEALAISDRIAVMKDGKIMQIDTPEEIYTHPANPFVAGFIGTSNFLACKITENQALVEGSFSCPIALNKDFSGNAIISVRPEHLFFAGTGLQGTITMSTFLGDFINYEIELDSGNRIELNEYANEMNTVREITSRVSVQFISKKACVYNAQTEELLS
ncbi:ABC-type spermidine/putrescine transport system, ATPase component [Sphaerochaeta pleomorpha str. Grapes]|uniref:ABC-type spermidine/putrescine transport system, ATPase component n=1 Tax=Sphaerochaeta pleomorpha (strain ATCC BAA-1885 / DSM 22778 / Grapes) TaxID=158190 RepID=G8QY53_SPHPG|nr:ABC transporter ATP-binding protein [Sphaerochaeta pleomorpha]AEV29618.1 ABC-type spermidine/putrescine transport system, ATPase component [Sphaerochaeta pleomorpha str. Grapes]